MIRGLVRFAREDDGQAVVELAVALPLVALMLLGLLQFGFAVNARQQLEGVARQGARTFALTGELPTTQAVLRVAGRQLADFEQRATVQIAFDPPAGGPRALSAPGRLSGIALPPGLAKKLRGYWVEVIVTYDFPNPVQATIFGSRVLPAAIPLATRAVARVEVDLK